MIIATAAVLAVLVGLQLFTLLRMGPRQLVGDEGDLERGLGPAMPPYFLRVPMMAWLLPLLGRRSIELSTRVLMAAAGCLAAVLVAAAAWVIAGWAGAFAALVFLLVLPERLLLNNHMWPDPLIALWLAAINLVLVLPLAPTAQAAILGILVCLSSLTRIEQVVLLIAVPWAFSFPASPTAAHLALICLPTITALVCWTLWNYRRHGIPLPDNTWIFNLMVADQELESDADVVRIDPLVIQAQAVWRQFPPSEAHRQTFEILRSLARRPWKLGIGVLKRAWSLLGPDTFVSERLLPPTGKAYPEMSESGARAWRAALRVTFPLAFAVLLALIAMGEGGLPPFAIPTILMFAAAAAAHSRTRFRLALLPGAALLLAWSMPSSIDSLMNAEKLVIGSAALALGVLLIVLPGRREEQ